jgi:hypothetical protein
MHTLHQRRRIQASTSPNREVFGGVHLLWASRGTSNDQPSILAAELGNGSTCDLTHQPLP